MTALTDFERLVLYGLADRETERATLLAQIDLASVVLRDPTGVGIYIHFAVSGRAPRITAGDSMLQGDPPVTLAHPALPSGAGAILWLTDGLIDTLECYTYDGDWPADESLFALSAT